MLKLKSEYSVLIDNQLLMGILRNIPFVELVKNTREW